MLGSTESFARHLDKLDIILTSIQTCVSANNVQIIHARASKERNKKTEQSYMETMFQSLSANFLKP